MVLKHYINGKAVNGNVYYHTSVDGIYEQHGPTGRMYSLVYYNHECLGNLEQVRANKLSFLVRFGVSFEQWCKKHRYKAKGGK